MVWQTQLIKKTLAKFNEEKKSSVVKSSAGINAFLGSLKTVSSTHRERDI